MFDISKRYNFSTIAPITLGENYYNLKVNAIVDFKMASKFRDVVSIHSAIENETNQELVPYRDAVYIIFSTEDDEILVLAKDWILESSIVAISKIDAKITISDINTGDLSVIRDALLSLNYNNIKIETVATNG